MEIQALVPERSLPEKYYMRGYGWGFSKSHPPGTQLKVASLEKSYIPRGDYRNVSREEGWEGSQVVKCLPPKHKEENLDSS